MSKAVTRVTAGLQAITDFFKRTRIGTVGTEQITPPLPGNREPGHAPGFSCPPSSQSMSALPQKAAISLILA